MLMTSFHNNINKPIINSSVLPVLNFLTDKRINHITIQSNAIMSFIRNLNPNKATGQHFCTRRTVQHFTFCLIITSSERNVYRKTLFQTFQ